MVRTRHAFALLAAIGVVSAKPVVDANNATDASASRQRLDAGALPTPATPSSPSASPSTTSTSINPATLSTFSQTQVPTTLTDCGTTYIANVVAQYLSLSTDLALQCQCFAQVNSWLFTTAPPTRTLTTVRGTAVTTFTTTGKDGKPTVGSSAVIETEIFTAATNFIEHGTDLWIGSASSPCCYSCTIAASTVEVFFFPSTTVTDTASAAVTSFVSNGVTFESPSVYVGFSSLSAYNYCGQLGKAFVNTTMAFDATELSSITFATLAGQPITGATTGPNGSPTVTTSTPIVFTAAGSAAINFSDLERNCSTIAGYTFIPGEPFNEHNSSPTFY
ncbi:hypothetical protein NQ176_g4033 [Zarea fungicola]|uniref:Uncharacterized protein n=1 Tax=Zarea fungicola TaxID=93591 RepID=A0ACC1NGM6_9HYPO|nr:hypothetical protein NQ176_g4033 [Lecanicillium fungicola]